MLANACRLSALTCWLLATGFMATTAAAAEAYRLQTGDAVDFTLLNATPIERRIMVGQDGSVSIPMGGSFQAAGRTIEELRAAVIETLKAVSYPSGVDAQGATVWNVIYPESVILEVGEYRPIYVSGDVLTPSSQAFRPGLTVEQVVALAGGASAFRARLDLSVDRARLDEETLKARTEAFAAGLRIARIQAELNGAKEPDFSTVLADGIDAGLIDNLRTLELEQFKARRQDVRKSRENTEANIGKVQLRLEYLKQSQVNLEAETRNYEEEVRRVEALLRKGLTPIDRLTNAQRGLFLVSTRSLDTSAELAQVERELGDLRRSLSKLDDTERMQNLTELQAATKDASDAAAQIETARRKALVVAGAGSTQTTIRYTIARRNGDAQSRADVGADAVLQPGDLVEVALDAKQP